MIISKGNPLLKGSTRLKDSYNFTFSCEADSVKLLLYCSGKKSPEHTVELTDSYKTGDVFSVNLSEVNLDNAMYCYEVDGQKIIDSYAKTVSGCEHFARYEEGTLHLSRVCLAPYDWEDDEPLETPYDESIFYKCSVRGFTKSTTSKVRHKGTFLGMAEKLPHLKELGITAVMLMPAYEYDEIGRFAQLYDNGYGKYASGPITGRINYWGYTKGFYFAPKAAFSSVSGKNTDYTTEFKDMIKLFHKNGIEVIMEMHFYDEATDFILDCLHYWVTEYHIDGIHLYADEAALNAAAKDSLLSKTKLITVYWDGEPKKFKNMANYNSGFMNVVRKFLKGDENQLGDFVNVSRYNPPQSANINYITSHDGFTLMDLVSYDRKHNESNGENNTDGENFNNSWNCGEEGASRKKKVLQLRRQQLKNAFLLLLLSQGTPLILAGDEFGNSQGGNNNPYCVDSEVSWVTWNNKGIAAELMEFVKEVIAFRKAKKILHMPKQLLAYDSISCGFPDVSCHGNSAWYDTMESYNRHIGIMYCSQYANIENALKDTKNEDENELLYIAYNMHWEEHELALPKADEECTWKLEMCSGNENSALIKEDSRTVWVAPRCIAVLSGKLTGKKPVKKRRVKKNELE